MEYVFNDGGRAAAGYKGLCGDCVTRSIAIASGVPYETIYSGINEFAKKEKLSKHKKSKSSARSGVYTPTIKKYMQSIGWKWKATMGIGTGCTVHVRKEELPEGKLVVMLSRHTTAVINGVIHDTYDPSRLGGRCVYGYFYKD